MTKDLEMLEQYSNYDPAKQKSSEQYLLQEEEEHPMIKFENYSGFWTKSNEELVEASISEINLVVKPGSLNAIIGPIGAGKSTILMSLLNEIPFFTGTLTT